MAYIIRVKPNLSPLNKNKQTKTKQQQQQQQQQNNAIIGWEPYFKNMKNLEQIMSISN